MKKTIKKSDIKRLVSECLNEAMRYDKETGRYFPNYTGNPHSDAGKYVANNRDDFNYARNDYKWKNKDNQDRFERLQWQNTHVDPYPSDPDREHEGDAEEYLDNHNCDNIVEKAAEELGGEFENMLEQFAQKARAKYPILRDNYYLRDLMYHLKDIFDDFGY